MVLVLDYEMRTRKAGPYTWWVRWGGAARSVRSATAAPLNRSRSAAELITERL